MTNEELAKEVFNDLYEVVNDIYKGKDKNDNTEDYYLIENKVHEQTISHRIAYRLENKLEVKKEEKENEGNATESLLKANNLSIDCEWNKHECVQKIFKCDLKKYKDEKTKKTIEKLEDEINYEYMKKYQHKASENELVEELKKKAFRPDIIVHKRGIDANNILYVEIKKTGEDLDFDILKLKCISDKDTYNYTIGLLIELKDKKAEYYASTSNSDLKSYLQEFGVEII